MFTQYGEQRQKERFDAMQSTRKSTFTQHPWDISLTASSFRA